MKCPVCGAGMYCEDGKSVFCKGARRHCFDISSKGYINLAVGHSGGGDPKEAVRSRTSFLHKGYYLPFAEAVCRILSEQMSDAAGIVIDAGCGEGYYTEMVADRCGCSVFGFDLSKAAVESGASRALRNDRNDLFYAVAGIYSLPVADESADAVINLFAPCAEAEFSRALKTDGVLLVASAGENHLYGLKKRVYDEPYKNEKRNDMPVNMKRVYHETVRFDITLDSDEDKLALFSMTPYYYRTSKENAERLLGDALVTEAEFDIDVFKKQ